MPGPAFSILFFVVIIPGAGEVPALLTVIFPFFARLFLSENPAGTEVKQYAEPIFLSRGIDTAGRAFSRAAIEIN
ncbi:MAG: hypothetical protein JW864_04730 [Spirochaetes bacterium]|nr:hypothetical protein [Spirochaetota bacterium]